MKKPKGRPRWWIETTKDGDGNRPGTLHLIDAWGYALCKYSLTGRKVQAHLKPQGRGKKCPKCLRLARKS